MINKMEGAWALKTREVLHEPWAALAQISVVTQFCYTAELCPSY